MEERFKVVYRGRLQPGFAVANVVARLVEMAGMDQAQAEKLLSKSRPTVVKRNLDQQTAERYCARLESVGMQMEAVAEPGETPPEAPVPETPAVAEPGTAAEAALPPPAPEPIAPSFTTPAAGADNPYASPQADLHLPRDTAQGIWLKQPKKVPASHGMHWIGTAIGMFLGHPWKWMGLVLVFIVIQMIISLIPFLGTLISSLLGMVFAGGLALAAQNQAEGKDFDFSYLFAGFGPPRNRLILAGVLYLGGFMLILLFIGLLAILLLGVSPSDFMSGREVENQEAILQAMAYKMPILFLLGMVLVLPLIMAEYFCIPLIALAGCGVWSAFKLSLRSCLINWLPFLVYGLSILAVSLVLMLGATAMAGIMAFLAMDDGGPSLILSFLPMLGMVLIMVPFGVIFGLSVFTSFRDIFHRDA